MNKIQWIIGVVIILVFITGLIFTLTSKQTEAIKIGFIGPLSGDVAILGQGEQNAVEMAVDEINSQGGINGRLIEVIYEDGKCDSKEGTIAAQKLIDIDKVKVILGGLCSSETLGVAPIAESNKVILFSAFSSSPDVTNAGNYVFRNAPSDSYGGNELADLVIKKHKRVAILTENTDYPQGYRRVFKERFTKLGGEIVADEVFQPGERDFKSYLFKIITTDPDAILLNPQAGITGGLVAKQIKELGITSQIYSNGPPMMEAQAKEIAGDAINGLITVDVPTLEENNPKADSFLVKYREKTGHDPEVGYYAGAGYDAVYIIAQALKKCGENTDCVRDYLYNMPEYCGAIGCYNFDENGDIVGIKFVIKQIVNGEIKEI